MQSNRQGEALQLLIGSRPSKDWVVVGDFNLHHFPWDSRCRTQDAAADDLLDWLEDRRGHILNDIEEPTHQSGSIIDLAIVSQGAFLRGATSRVDDSLATGSDHATITVAVPLRGQAKGDDQNSGRFNIRQV